MSIEAEYLKRIIKMPERAFTTPISETDFEIEEFGMAFAELKRQIKDGTTPNVVTIAAALPQYEHAIRSLRDPMDNEVDHFEEIMIEHVINRRARLLAEEIPRRLNSGEMSDKFLPWLMGAVAACNVSGSASKLTTFYDYAMEFGPIIEERYENKGKLLGVPSGIVKLDEILGGFKPAVYFIGARPSQGKTALLLSMLRYAARKGHTVAMISLESSQHAIIARVISAESKIKMHSLATGGLEKDDFSRLQSGFQRIKGWNGYLVFDPKSQLADVERHCSTLVRAGGADIIFIDYLQRINAPGRNKTEQVGMASRTITDLSRTLNVPIVCMAQTGRQADNEEPSMSHFQHNSQIEQDADVAMVITHSFSGEGDQEKRYSQIHILKNRDGDIGDVPIFADFEYAKFLTRGEI